MSHGIYTLTEADVIAAYRLCFRTYMFSHTGLRQIGLFLLWPVALGLGTGLFIARDNGFGVLGGGMILALCVLVFLLLAGLYLAFGYSRYRRQAHEYYRAGGLQGVAIEWTCTEQGRHASTPNIQTDFAWTDYRSWAEDTETLLLYWALPLQFQIIPKRGVSAHDITTMRNYLIAAAVPQIGPLR